ncbi:MAG: homoserine dehydrogenase [Verrucomicrobiae bacterium]|nr:homoserine dehydrogenase [Verrucomicrobiae bacterium]
MRTVHIGLAGFGTVGSAVFRNLQSNAELLARRCGMRPEIVAIAAKNLSSRAGGAERAAARLLVRDLDVLVADSRVELIVELIGGCGVARRLILSSLRAGKPVVTANKALLAEHGREIFIESRRHGAPVWFEASVAGGIPLIQALREGLVANRFRLLYGIVNGTCNYILSRMTLEGAGFEEALREAQAQGFAEADPTFDIDGYDAAHKATVLASLVAGGCVNFRKVPVEGIRHITVEDIRFAQRLGYALKLLAIIRSLGPNHVEVRVHPTLIPVTNRLASIHGVTNAVMVRGSVVGDVEFSGPGAGGDATSSAVISDLMEAARHVVLQKERVKGAPLPQPPSAVGSVASRVAPAESIVSRYYLRLGVLDRPGVLARIASILGAAKIGISSVLQPEGHEGRVVPLILMTHDARHGAMLGALARIRRLPVVKSRPVVLRVETFES